MRTNRHSPLSRGLLLFLGAEGLIYLSFLILDIGELPGPSMKIKYAGILLCLAFAWIRAAKTGHIRLRTAPGPALRREGLRTDGEAACGANASPAGTDISPIRIALALSFTAAADWCLIFVRNNLLGLLFFLAVQCAYWLELRGRDGRARPGLRLITEALMLAALTALGLWKDPVSVLAAVYFGLLAANTLQAFLDRRGLFALGLLLFMGCDICVGLYNMELGLTGLSARLVSVGMWFFYLPSQVLIALSAGDGERK